MSLRNGKFTRTNITDAELDSKRAVQTHPRTTDPWPSEVANIDDNAAQMRQGTAAMAELKALQDRNTHAVEAC